MARTRSWPRKRRGAERIGRLYLGGLLQHARASTVFTTPTINGYKRYRSYSLAPDRAIWGRDNRGVMIRVLGGADNPRHGWKTGSASRRPIRISTWLRKFSPASTASIARWIPARPPTRLMKRKPRFAEDAAGGGAGAQGRSVFPRGARRGIVDYYVHIKNAEIERFQAEVSDWSSANISRCFDDAKGNPWRSA